MIDYTLLYYGRGFLLDMRKIKRPFPPETKSERKKYDNDKFYWSRQWKEIRKQHKQQEPLCRTCKGNGIIKAGRHSDHIIPINERPDLATRIDNLQNLCEACHNKKTARE